MRIIKRTAAALTAVASIVSMSVFCFASTYDTLEIKKQVSQSITYSNTASFTAFNGVYTKNQVANNAYAVTAKPGVVSAAVASSTSVYGKATVSAMAGAYNANGKRVIAAINGDFFSGQTGIPLGLQIINKKIITTNLASYDKEQGRTNIGFNADGCVVFGVPEIDITLSVDDYSVKIDRINAMPNYWYSFLLTSDYGTQTTWETKYKYDVIVLKADGDLTIGGNVTCHFDSFIENTNVPQKIEKGKIYVIARTGYFKGFTPPEPVEDGMPEGIPETETVPEGVPEAENVTEDVTAEDDTVINDVKGESKTVTYEDESAVKVTEKTGRWANVVNAMGAGNLLVNEGVIRYPSTYDSSIRGTLTSRSAFGVKADGSYVFYTVEKNTTVKNGGVMMAAVAQAMHDMGCVYAVNLDGGGSTTILADTGYGLKLRNKCQDGAQRRVSNALLLVADESAPVILEDFETAKEYETSFDEPNLIAARSDGAAYTGGSALALDYSISDITGKVSVTTDPIDIKNYSKLSLAIDMGKSGVTLHARLKSGDKEFTRGITKSAHSGYIRYVLDVADADTLVGFCVTYNENAKNNGTIKLDRLVGYRGAVADNTAPSLSVSVADGKINSTISEPVFSAGVDPQGAEVLIDGTLYRGNSVDVSALSADKINKARVDAVDKLGNRTVTYTLFKSAAYNKAAPFADMKDGKWDALAIRYCNENGIISGFKENGQTLFKGSENVTRAQFCVMVVNQKKLDVTKYASVVLPYTDLADIPSWALPYVKAAFAEGIMTGSKTDSGVAFYPNSNITRAEAASALDRLTVKDSRLNASVVYKDAKDIAKWAKDYVISATQQGLFMGDKDGNFYPKNNLTRSEAAVLMSKL